MYVTDKYATVRPREERKLERLMRNHPDPRDLSDRVAGTSEETADLFNSEYKPWTEWGEDPREE